MKGEYIPEQDHISRYCKPTTAPEGQIQASAFMIRLDEDSLSVNWVEFLNCRDRTSEIQELRKIYSSTFRKIGAKAKIAILNVGKICEKVRAESPESYNIKVLHDPLADDPSHSGIYNLSPDPELIAELILSTLCDNNIYSARE